METRPADKQRCCWIGFLWEIDNQSFVGNVVLNILSRQPTLYGVPEIEAKWSNPYLSIQSENLIKPDRPTFPQTFIHRDTRANQTWQKWREKAFSFPAVIHRRAENWTHFLIEWEKRFSVFNGEVSGGWRKGRQFYLEIRCFSMLTIQKKRNMTAQREC